MRGLLVLVSIVLLAVLAGAARAQVQQTAPGTSRAKPGLGLPALPRLTRGSPRDTLLYADRAEVRPAASDFPPGFSPAAAAPVLVDKWVSKDLTGTGFAELIQYQLPVSYAPGAAPIPLLVAWHGFSESAASVSVKSTLDEWCDASGWAYLSVTGLDDALFGSPPSQQNAEAAIQWMLDNFTIDPDRVYMVGFSMGAGIVSNFAARHRGPDGIMIAGLGLVSGVFDWIVIWNNDPLIQPWMMNPYNFGASPDQDVFAYRRVGALAFDPAASQPVLGNHLPIWAMATNLHDVPTYVTWDVNDLLSYVPPQCETYAALLGSMGTIAMSRPVSGTIDPDVGIPATHSWAVLDEAELFAFLAPHSTQRLPAVVDAQLDQDGEVSSLQLLQDQASAFSWLQSEVDTGSRRVTLDGVTNASVLTLDLDAAGLSGGAPVRVIASSADPAGFTLRLSSGTSPPSYLVDSLTGQIVPGVESDPFGAALLLDVPGDGNIDVSTMHLGWGSRLWLTPDPAAPGETISFGVIAPPGAKVAWTLVGTSLAPTPIAGGLVLLVSATPPSVLVPVPLDIEGNVLLTATLPNNAALLGASLLVQAVIQGPGGAPVDATNVFRFDIE